MTCSWLNCLASNQKHGSINMWGVDWTTSIQNQNNWQMLCDSSSSNSISGLGIQVCLEMSHISSEDYTTGIFLNVSKSSSHITHFTPTMILNWCASLSLRVVKYIPGWKVVIGGGGMHRINVLSEQPFGQSLVHPTRVSRPIFGQLVG